MKKEKGEITGGKYSFEYCDFWRKGFRWVAKCGESRLYVERTV